MLHILLTILKIIGIILLAIIGLVLLICLCVLFVPIRYSARIKYDETANICVRVSYLLRLISIKYVLNGKDKKTSIKIFGIDINRFKRKNKSDKQAFNDEADNETDDKGSAVDIFEEVKEDRYIEKADEDLKKAAKENMKVKDEDSDNTKSAEKERISIYQRIKKKIISIKNKIIYRFKSICGKIRKVISKIKDFKAFISDEHTKRVLLLIKGELFKLLKYIKPHTVKGYLNFGFDDPSVTGKVLGVYYAIMKKNPKKFSVNPDFENKRLETDVLFKGRICLYYLVYIILKVYFNKDFKYVLKQKNK
ncbi:MAG: DUF2953 domain-containing protein [Lachnospiraceae bacterium]|nr:DUF2953 domain-containing protein [Lachnospiraceae bacterium]